MVPTGRPGDVQPGLLGSAVYPNAPTGALFGRFAVGCVGLDETVVAMLSGVRQREPHGSICAPLQERNDSDSLVPVYIGDTNGEADSTGSASWRRGVLKRLLSKCWMVCSLLHSRAPTRPRHESSETDLSDVVSLA